VLKRKKSEAQDIQQKLIIQVQ